jgi:hypothetical protein
MYPRVKVHRRVEFQHAGGKGEGMLLDLSLQGCRIKGVFPGSSGIRVRLQLWLPDQAQPVKVERGTVRWVQDDQFGVSFLEVLPDAQARLAQVVQLLLDAQQPDALVIQIPASTSQDSASRGFRKGRWEPMDDR